MKSGIEKKKNLIGNSARIKLFWKPKEYLTLFEATDFHDKEMPKAGSSYTCYTYNSNSYNNNINCFYS